MRRRHTGDHGDTFDHKGHTFSLQVERDEYMGEPWKEHDGHGPVSDWRKLDDWQGRVSKAPGERVLVQDRHSARFYDMAAAAQLAKKDGWGCPHSTRKNHNGTHATAGEMRACAVEADFQHLRAWCNDDWYWCTVVVTLLEYVADYKEDPDGDYQPTDETETLGGIESSDDKYIRTDVAVELADEILARVEVDTPLVQLSEN